RRVAEAAVGALEPLQVRECTARRRLAGGQEGLDRPSRRLRVGAAAAGQLETTVAVAVAKQEPERAPNRAAPDAGCAERFDPSGGVVRVGSTGCRPPAARASLPREEPADRAAWDRLPRCPEGEHAPGGAVDEAADRAVVVLQRAKAR